MGRAEAELLRILRDQGEAYQADLVRATGLSKAAVSESLRGLELKRFVRRTKVGRSSKVSLVGRGGRRRPRKTLILGFARAAEYPFLVPLRQALRDDGIGLEFRVYDNGLSVARDLSNFEVDVGVAPILSLFMFHALEAPFRVVGPAGAGGSCVLASPKSHSGEAPTAMCTKMSTMEMLIRSAANRHTIPEMGSITYASSPEEMATAVMSGAADFCSIWEPYATILEARGARRVVRYSDLLDHVCCALAAGNHLEEPLVSKISRRHADSLASLKRDRDSFLPPYAAMTGIETSILRRVSSEYYYPEDLDFGKLVGQLETAGLSVPAPGSFEQAIFKPRRAA